MRVVGDPSRVDGVGVQLVVACHGEISEARLGAAMRHLQEIYDIPETFAGYDKQKAGDEVHYQLNFREP